MVFGIEIGIWRRREGEGKARVRGDSLYTEGIRRRMINYWYSVVTAECSVGLPLFFVFYFFLLLNLYLFINRFWFLCF